MIEKVTFDWWFTIVRLSMPGSEYRTWAKDTRVDGMLDVLRDAGVNMDRDRLSTAYDRFSEHIEKVWERNADMNPEEQMAVLLQYAGLRKLEDDTLLRRLQEPFGRVLLDRPPLLNDGIVECFETLKSEGYRIGLISNTGRTWGRFLVDVQKMLGIHGFFEVLTFSDEVGLRKPHEGIFNLTLKKMNASPETTVHIGDDVDADVKGARSVGMRAVWFNDGTWPDAKCEDEDAEINHFGKFPEVVRRL